MNELHCRPGVDDDVYELARYLIEQNEEVARRFVDAVQTTLKDLAKMPGMGSPKDFSDPSLAGVRSWRVKGFPNHLIYYIRRDEGIDVLAVMHGSRNVEPWLKRRV